MATELKRVYVDTKKYVGKNIYVTPEFHDVASGKEVEVAYREYEATSELNGDFLLRVEKSPMVIVPKGLQKVEVDGFVQLEAANEKNRRGREVSRIVVYSTSISK